MTSLEEQRHYYTSRWQTFSHANLIELSRAAAILSAIDTLALEESPSICDLGCGAGWLTSILGMFGPTLGVDLADVSVPQQRYPHCQFISADILCWDGPEEAFDVVVSQEVIEHIDWEKQIDYAAKAASLLRPGGHLILTTPNARTLKAMPNEGRDWTHQPLENWLTRSQLSGILKEHFCEVSLRSFVFGIGSAGSYRVANSHKVRLTLKRAGLNKAFDAVLSRANYGVHFLAVGRKRE